MKKIIPGITMVMAASFTFSTAAFTEGFKVESEKEKKKKELPAAEESSKKPEVKIKLSTLTKTIQGVKYITEVTALDKGLNCVLERAEKTDPHNFKPYTPSKPIQDPKDCHQDETEAFIIRVKEKNNDRVVSKPLDTADHFQMDCRKKTLNQFNDFLKDDKNVEYANYFKKQLSSHNIKNFIVSIADTTENPAANSTESYGISGTDDFPDFRLRARLQDYGPNGCQAGNAQELASGFKELMKQQPNPSNLVAKEEDPLSELAKTVSKPSQLPQGQEQKTGGKVTPKEDETKGAKNPAKAPDTKAAPAKPTVPKAGGRSLNENKGPKNTGYRNVSKDDDFQP